jgi:hypothetical protein
VSRDVKKKAMWFAIPMQWREQKNHYDDCYFCTVNVAGHNKKNKKGIIYPNLLSVLRPVSRGTNLPVPSQPDNLSDECESVLCNRTLNISSHINMTDQ